MALSPVFTDTVNQQFFIEALGGARQPTSYLDRFPDTVYTKGIDSVLVTFLYALLGPVGIGYLRQEYLEARLQFEQAGLTVNDLDALYTQPFAFARAALETYTVDASAGLLSSEQRAQILSADSAFRNRAITFFKGIRAGGTELGLSLAAESGLNHPVDVVENYRALYDQYADLPLGLPYLGSTTALSEVIVMPRQNVPESASQTISLNGEPTSGWFTLTLPNGPNYRQIQSGLTKGSSTVTVPNSAQIPPGTYFTIQGTPDTYAAVGSVLSPTSVSLVHPPQTPVNTNTLVNLVPNPSFEWDAANSQPAVWSATSPGYWVNSGATLNVNSAGGKQGPHYLNVVTTATVFEGVTCPLVGTFKAGVTYNASIWMIGAAGGEVISFGLGAASANSATTVVTLAAGWVLYNVSWTPTQDEAVAYIVARTNTATALTFRIDGAMVVQSNSTPTYFDGDTSGYGWSGTPGNSTSVPVNAGSPFVLTQATGTFTAYVGNAQTVPLPYNTTYAQIQAALWALPVVGSGNVLATGGPLPDQPVEIDFTSSLADQPMPAFQVNLAPDTIAGIGGPSAAAPLVSQLTDASNNALTISPNVTVDQVGVSADSQTAAIAPADQHAMELALDQIRPVTTIITNQPASSVTQRQPTNTIFAGSSYTEVLRYGTGSAALRWPALDQAHWIESGKEHEAPHPVGDLSHHYQGFHNITNIIAYTEAALSDPSYQTSNTTLGTTYWDTMIGIYSQAQVALYPFLGSYTDPANHFSPTLAQASSPEPLVISDTLSDGTGVINGIYPTDYLGVPGVPQLPTTQSFWSSSERAPADADSTDYLEIDLGSVQPVNYLYFEATSKPYAISLAYDGLDQSPGRQFVAVTLMPPTEATSVTSLAYNATATNPWSVVELHFTNALQQMIFTRYLRIGFTRTPGNTPFITTSNVHLPYSIEVRNLRVGRNLASPMDRVVSISTGGGLSPGGTLYPGSDVFPGSN